MNSYDDQGGRMSHVIDPDILTAAWDVHMCSAPGLGTIAIVGRIRIPVSNGSATTSKKHNK
jgi:hypothetical protein